METNQTAVIHAAHRGYVLCDNRFEWQLQRDAEVSVKMATLRRWNKHNFQERISCQTCREKAAELMSKIEAAAGGIDLYSGDNPAPFDTPIETLRLTVRAFNCLVNDNVLTIGEVVKQSESQLLRIPNFGKISLQDVKEALARVGRYLDTDVEAELKAETYENQLAVEVQSVLAEVVGDDEKARDWITDLKQRGYRIVRA